MEAIVAAMPGTVYKIQSSSTQRFQRLFWAFGPSINGWKYCRPILSLDGTFLLGKYRGTLLIAVGLDANNGLFPLAFGIVESECNESWIWFLRMLHELVPSISSRNDLCIISDRHAGLVRGCREIFPSAAHRHCLRHLRENFKKAVRQMGISDVEFVCQKMYTVGITDDPDLFNQMMVDIIKIKPEIHQWLVDRDLSKWTLLFDGGFRYGVMTTKSSEAFNGILKRARGLPVQALIIAIYYNIVRMFIRRLEIIIAEEHQSNNFFSAFMEGLRMLGLDCVSQLQYIRMDHNLLTALVERWSPQTNSFHLPVGEMSITLQDVALILGLHIDGPALVGHNVVGAGRRWLSWPDCCDDLLGQHPQRDVVYVDPFNPRVSSKFRMGQAQAQTCLPLRWLRWTFYRDSYLDMNELDFWRHLRAYIFLMGTYLLPDTSGCEIHLRFLPLLENLGLFSTYSLGGAVLAHLYRELAEATKPKRANIAGCIHLLQIWCWERLHVGRPTLHVPQQVSLDGLSVGYRWNQQFIRQLPAGSLSSYRDELDGLLDSQVTWEPYTIEIKSQVADIYLSGRIIWLARVPLVAWTRVEWHLPERVLRQFGFVPTVDVHPMEPKFVRVDGRGKSDTYWLVYYLHYIGLWEDKTAHIIEGTPLGEETKHLIQHYLQWFRSWATLYMLRPTSTPPTTYYPRSPSERYMVNRPFFILDLRNKQSLLHLNN
ncbi:hypothetical protein M5K25_015542 [Dendrobium thyrsiflorum]|uniref:Mutator-like transposase n=1 Tax=Dendrobium thyrsiflorum TaxID=117978 RepID=A0ABD0URF4_DENTH